MNSARPVRFSQAAQNALTRILQSSSIRPGPDMLDAVLLKLELQERFTVPEILLRRELRRVSDGDRESLSRSLATGAPKEITSGSRPSVRLHLQTGISEGTVRRAVQNKH